MQGTFEIFQSADGKTRFRLKASNGRILLVSECYQSKSTCRRGVQSVITNAGDVARFNKRRSKDGYLFVMVTTNGKVLCTSETYASERTRDKGIASIGRQASRAGIHDLTTNSGVTREYSPGKESRRALKNGGLAE